jgi:hypothetical protein
VGMEELRQQDEQRNALARRDSVHNFRPGANQARP